MSRPDSIPLGVTFWRTGLEVMSGPGSRGNILWLDFFLFSRSKASDTYIGIITNVVCLGKTRFQLEPVKQETTAVDNSSKDQLKKDWKPTLHQSNH